MRRSKLTIEQVLAWADAHHARTGRWPTASSGAVRDVTGEKWAGINAALWGQGRRLGLKQMTLSKLLAKHRGVRNQGDLPKLTISQILAWSDKHYERTGEWPNYLSEPIPGTDETWSAVAMAIWRGRRGLSASTLPRLLNANRDDGYLLRPVFTITKILEWEDQHQERTGKWPHSCSGSILAMPRVRKVGSKKTSLFKLLKSKRSAPWPSPHPPLTLEQILAWADDHFQRTGEWPRVKSGPILAAPHEN
jgi:hypothetical protein